MAESSKWRQDSLNFVGSFLGDEEPIDVEVFDFDDAANTGLRSKLDQRMPVDDDSLFSYLSGEFLDDPPDEVNNSKVTMEDGVIFVRPNGKPQTKRQNDCEVSSNTFTGSEAIIVITKSPSLPDSNGISEPNSQSKSNQSSAKSKLAIKSRERRLRCKEYVSQLETSVKKLTEENQQLKAARTQQARHVEKLQEKVKYLQSISANKYALSALLKNVLDSSCATLKDLTADSEKEKFSGQDAGHHNATGEKRKLATTLMDRNNLPVNCSEDISSRDATSASTSKARDTVVNKPSPQQFNKLSDSHSQKSKHAPVKQKKVSQEMEFIFI